MNVATLNVHYLTNPKSIAELISDNDIHVCGMQEVGGEKTLKQLLKFLPNYDGLFDKTYYTFGNGIVYSTNVFKYMKSQTLFIGSHSGTKRSLFIVELLHKSSGKQYSFCVTHLDHVSETNRLIEWNNAIKFSKDCIILGDMNALTQSDYSKDKLENITNVRVLSKWEPPKFDLMNMISMTHIDCVSKLYENGDDRKTTSRFNTRIDYVLTPISMKDCIEKSETIDCFKYSDHSMVYVRFSL